MKPWGVPKSLWLRPDKLATAIYGLGFGTSSKPGNTKSSINRHFTHTATEFFDWKLL